jgi:hypothetical protein
VVVRQPLEGGCERSEAFRSTGIRARTDPTPPGRRRRVPRLLRVKEGEKRAPRQARRHPRECGRGILISFLRREADEQPFRMRVKTAGRERIDEERGPYGPPPSTPRESREPGTESRRADSAPHRGPRRRHPSSRPRARSGTRPTPAAGFAGRATMPSRVGDPGRKRGRSRSFRTARGPSRARTAYASAES